MTETFDVECQICGSVFRTWGSEPRYCPFCGEEPVFSDVDVDEVFDDSNTNM